MTKTLYSYDANTQRAKVYHRTTGAVVCDVSGVDLYVGNLLDRLADEMYQSGYEAGRKDAIGEVTEELVRMARRFP
jgi:hypothetical protein